MENAKGSPTKDFFVRMVTRDISLNDCILDLIDNCLDGARKRSTKENDESSNVIDYNGHYASLKITPEKFIISDNCGGISISDAIDYAFHFGRRPDAPNDGDHSIGLYGIGMKRAILKMGKNIKIHSSTEKEAFICKIDVNDWLSRPDDWDFDMYEAEKIDGTGTIIEINNLYPYISAEFSDTIFQNKLKDIISRDYSIFLDKGFDILINDVSVKGHVFSVKTSDEFRPHRISYQDRGVKVDIIAGMSAPPPDDTGPPQRTETSYYGWYVFCNDRVVVAADKSSLTVWGDEEFQNWHYQYNGFIGMVMFSSGDPKLLPWTTTKRDIDESSPLYRRAINEMKSATLPWIEYTNRRKADLEAARETERAALSVSFFKVGENPTFSVPTPPPDKPRIRMTSIQYSKPQSEVKKVAAALGNANMYNYQVGIETFEYFVKNELEDD